MKILLAAVNAKYIHSNLAVYSLAAYAEKELAEKINCGDIDLEIAEYTINQPMEKILRDLYMKKPDVLFLSCYIWNRREVEELATDLGKIRPELDIWFGGPEVSFDAEETLMMLPGLKGVICGEGEEKFVKILRAYDASLKPDDLLNNIQGIVFRDGKGKTVATVPDSVMDLSCTPFPYESLEGFEHRILYYESSRGCPFRCSYCLSSVDKQLRFRNLDLVKQELAFFLEKNVPQVKFIDRTFNCDHRHAMEIWNFIKEHDNGVTNFHFEIAGDILNHEELELMNRLRPGQIQLEIGVQSTNENTLAEINRPMDVQRLGQIVDRIKSGNNIHIHLDLIAGLPLEDYDSFKKSFDDVFAMRPEQLQLGFLKVLKGSPLALKKAEYGLKHTEFPPYEVLATRWISYDELMVLKAVEEMVEVYYNSGQFMNTIDLMMGYFERPFAFFERLAAWYSDREIEMLNFSRNGRYEQLLKFCSEYVDDAERERLLDALILDYYLRENVKTRPVFFGEERVDKLFAKKFYQREAQEHRYLQGGMLATDDSRLLRKLTHLERFGDRYYLFDYTKRNAMTNNAYVTEIE